MFITGGSPHLVSEHFLGLVGWNFWEFCFFVVLLGAVSLVVLLLLVVGLFIGSRIKTYPLNCGKYLCIALKLIVRSTIGTPKYLAIERTCQAKRVMTPS